MIPTPKTDTWIDINTFDVPIDEYKQLAYIHQKEECEYKYSELNPHFTFTKYVAAAAIGIDVPSNQDMVKVCYTFYPVDEELQSFLAEE
jgi:hypothetical protein